MASRHPVVMALLVALALSGLALAVRLPALQTIPQLTDETGEVATAISIVRDGARPLVHNDAYRGPAWAYLMAGALAIVGSQPWLPRLVAALLSALTVGATYLLADALAGRRAGFVAALVMTAAFGPVALNAHVAWSNHATPLWVTLAALLTWCGRQPDRWGRLALVAGGGLWGIALQSHPSALAPLVGAGLWWCAAADRRRLLRTPAPWLAIVAFAVVMSPLLVYNLASSGASVREAGASGQPLAITLDPRVLVPRVIELAGQLGRTAGAGPLPEAGDPTSRGLVAITDAARPWSTAGYALVLLAALARAAWVGPRYIAWLAGATLIVLPILNRNYTSFYDQRYIGLLLPLAATALGAWVAQAWAAASGHTGRRATLALFTGVIIAYPLLAVAGFQQRELAAGRTNTPLLAVTARLASAPDAMQDLVLVDKALRDLDLGGGGDPARAFVHLLTLSKLPAALSDVDEMRWFLERDPGHSIWIIGGAQAVDELGPAYGLITWEQGAGWTILERPARPGGASP